MKLVRKSGRGAVNTWSSKKTFFGMTYVNPNIPSLKYGRDMEIEVVNMFSECIKNYH